MKSRVTLVGLLVFFLGSLVWLSIPATKVSAQSTQAICVGRCNENYNVCHDRAVDALTACLAAASNAAAREQCTDIYEGRQARCKAAHDACIDGC